jgi:hypothetical protein
MKQEVHHAQTVRVGDKLRANEGIVPLEERFLLRQFVEIVSVIFDVTVGGDEEPGCACCRVLHGLACLWFHESDDAVDQPARSKILPGPRFLIGRILL